jgi:hypothetical protein
MARLRRRLGSARHRSRCAADARAAQSAAGPRIRRHPLAEPRTFAADLPVNAHRCRLAMVARSPASTARPVGPACCRLHRSWLLHCQPRECFRRTESGAAVLAEDPGRGICEDLLEVVLHAGQAGGHRRRPGRCHHPAALRAGLRSDLTTIPLRGGEPGHVVLDTRSEERSRLVAGLQVRPELPCQCPSPPCRRALTDGPPVAAIAFGGALPRRSRGSRHGRGQRPWRQTIKSRRAAGSSSSNCSPSA